MTRRKKQFLIYFPIINKNLNYLELIALQNDLQAKQTNNRYYYSMDIPSLG